MKQVPTGCHLHANTGHHRAGAKVSLDPDPVGTALQDVAVQEGLDFVRHEVHAAGMNRGVSLHCQPQSSSHQCT